MDPETRERLDMLAKAHELRKTQPEKSRYMMNAVRRRIYKDMQADGSWDIMTPAQAAQECNARLRELEGQAS